MVLSPALVVAGKARQASASRNSTYQEPDTSSLCKSWPLRIIQASPRPPFQDSPTQGQIFLQLDASVAKVIEHITYG